MYTCGFGFVSRYPRALGFNRWMEMPETLPPKPPQVDNQIWSFSSSRDRLRDNTSQGTNSSCRPAMASAHAEQLVAFDFWTYQWGHGSEWLQTGGIRQLGTWTAVLLGTVSQGAAKPPHLPKGPWGLGPLHTVSVSWGRRQGKAAQVSFDLQLRPCRNGRAIPFWAGY